jgi:uncharacterized protein YjdB
VGLNGNVNSNIIFDHCSFAFGGDEFLSFRGDTHTTTVQNCLFAYGKTGMLAGDSDDTSRGWDFSILNNFWHTIGKRTPNPNSNGRIDVIGNVTYNILNLGMRTSGSIQLNEIGNYYRRAGGHRLNFGGGATPLIHTSNNRFGSTLTENGQDNSVIWGSWLGGPDPQPSDFVADPFPLLNYTDALPDGDDALLQVQNRERGANAYLSNSGTPVYSLDDLDTEAYDQFDSDQYFDWDDGTGNSTQASWELIPQRQWLLDNQPNFGVVVNEHDQSTHTGVVPNSWIINQGLDPATFNPLGNDLDSIYTNIEIYSFGVDNAEIVVAESVAVTPTTATINIPETIDLDVVFTPEDTTNKTGEWQSLDENIATVDSNGVVTPVSQGIVTITFTSNDGGFVASATITVTNETIDAQAVEVNPDAMTLDIGQTQQATVNFTPANTTNQNGTWSSEDENIATVNQNGEVTGVSEGTTNVIFTSEDGGFADSVEIIVADVFFGTYELFNAESDEFIQFITEDTALDMAVIGNQVNFRVIPQGGDNNPDVESVQVQWTGPENGELVQSFPIYSGMADHSADGTQFDSYFVSEGTYNFTITFWDEDNAEGNIVSVDNFALTFFLDNGVIAYAGNDVSICEGEAVTLTATGGTSYLWNTGENTASITVSPNTTTTYSVTVSNDSGDTDADEVIVTVNAIPIAQVTENQTICSGESVTLTASGGDTYLWSNGETSASILVSPTEDTEYTVEVISNGCSSTANTTVTVNESPQLSVSNDTTIITGDSVTLTASGAESYEWNTGDLTASITVSPSETTTYQVTGFLGTCSATAEVTVTVEEVFVASAGEDQRICQNSGSNVELTASAGDSYLWNTGETTQTIYVNPLSTTTYSVTVTSGIQQASDEVTVFVDPNPNVVISNGDSVDILDGDFITLSASGANSYEWSNGATQPNIAVSPSQTTIYEVRGYVNDCYDEKQVTVNVYPEVVANAGEDQLVCLGESIVLTATGGDDYLWSNGETTASIEVSPNVTTDYTVTVFNAMDFDEDTVRVEVASCDVNAELPGEDINNGSFSFDLYPNPASSVVNIKINGSLVVSKISVYDIMGKLVLQQQIENNNLSPSITKQVNVNTLTNGVYFVKMEDGVNEIVRKLIVN